MNFAVISDIHLGTEPGVDEFGHTVESFTRFLHWLESTHSKIYLNGDVFEGLRGRRLGRRGRHSEVFRAYAKHSILRDRLTSAKYEWISGNHDPDTAELGIPQYRVLEYDTTRILFVHGEQFDRIEQCLPGLSPLVNWVNAWTNRWIGRDADDGLYRLEAWLLGIREEPKRDAFQRKAVHAAKSAGADVIIVGHTHSGGVFRHPEAIYANSGTCSLGRFEWLSVDIPSRTVSFHRGSTDNPAVHISTWGTSQC